MIKFFYSLYSSKRKHYIVSSKKPFIIQDLILSPNEKIKIIKLEDYKLYGLMENKYGSGFHLISNISISSKDNKSIINISNSFDALTITVHFSVYIIFWGLCAYDLTANKGIDFVFYIRLIVPIISTVIIKLSFDFYDKKVLSLINKFIQ